MVTKEQKIRYKELVKVRKKLQNKSHKQMKIIKFIFIAIGALIGLLIAMLEEKAEAKGIMDSNKFLLYFYGGTVVCLISFIIHIILHEAGHLFFGLMTGYQFLSFRIYSLIFFKKNGRICTSKYSIKGTGGQCLMYPPKRQLDGSYPFVLYNLGGGISNLLFSVLFLIPALLTNHLFVNISFWVFIFTGILTALTNVIPMSAGLQNDGMNLKSMLKDKSMRDAFYVQLKVNAEMSEGKRITDYSKEEFMLPENTDVTNMLTAHVRIMSYYQKLAYHNYEGAEIILVSMEEKAEKLQPATLNVLNLERLFFMVLNHSPLEEIASLYKYCRVILVKSKTNIDILRVNYIYETFLSEEEKKEISYLITGRMTKKWKSSNKEKLYHDFMKTAKNYPVSGYADTFVELVNDLRQEVGERNDS